MGVLNAGELDRSVGLYHATLARDSATGEQTSSFTSYATVFAKRVDLTGTKRLIGSQTVNQQQIEYTIRFRTDVLSTDRLIDSDAGLTLEIMQIAQLGRREALSILCRAVLL